MAHVGTTDNPLRVAIVGSGPAGFFTVGHLIKHADLRVEIDMFDRLPTPYGLVRYGVAPDHPKDKTVTRAFDKSAQNPHFRFFGSVSYGDDLTLRELKEHYHQVVFATGAQTECSLGIPGADLNGSHPAAEFVAWYNGHPDFTDRQFDLAQQSVAIVGMGNVALDVARILCSTYTELVQTDIADYALSALRDSHVRNVYLLGRRGPAQAAFTPPEIRALGDLSETDVRVLPEEGVLDAMSAEYLIANPDRKIEKNVACIEQYAGSPATDGNRRLTLRFFVSPLALLATAGKLSALRLTKNEPYRSADGSVRARATDREETIPAGLVFRSIGYRGVALPEIPFDDSRGTIANENGRITSLTGTRLTGLYCAGWIKRGPTGVIGTNKTCAQQTVRCMLADLASDEFLHPPRADPQIVAQLIRERCKNAISYPDWKLIDAAEVSRGKAVNRPRIKFTDIDAMLAALGRRPGIDPVRG